MKWLIALPALLLFALFTLAGEHPANAQGSPLPKYKTWRLRRRLRVKPTPMV